MSLWFFFLSSIFAARFNLISLDHPSPTSANFDYVPALYTVVPSAQLYVA